MTKIQFKEKHKRLRLIFTSEKPKCMTEKPDGIFAVIGPFDSFTAKPEIQDALM